jgi:hypothetical protein
MSVSFATSARFIAKMKKRRRGGGLSPLKLLLVLVLSLSLLPSFAFADDPPQDDPPTRYSLTSELDPDSLYEGGSLRYDQSYIFQNGKLISNKINGPSGTAAPGEYVTLFATPSSGFRLAPGSLVLNGDPDALSDMGSYYRFVMPAEDVHIAASFTAVEGSRGFYLDAAIQNGTVRPAMTSVVVGTSTYINIRPAEGYQLKPGSLMLDDIPLGLSPSNSARSASFVMPDHDVSVTALFEPIPTYQILFESGQGGSLNADPSAARAGDTVNVSAMPDEGYRLVQGSVTARDASGGEVALVPGTLYLYRTYSFVMPASAITIEASFEPAGTAPERGPADLTIATVEELEAFRDAVNAGEPFTGKLVCLAADIDLTGRSWTPIGIAGRGNDAFEGVFDGAGHTVTLDGYGLFRKVLNGIVENLTTTGTMTQGGGAVASSAYNSHFSNCKNYASAAILKTNSSPGAISGIVLDCLYMGPESESTNDLYYGLDWFTGELVAIEEIGVFDCINYGDIFLQREEKAYGQHWIEISGSAAGISFRAERIVNCSNEGDITAGSYGTPAYTLGCAKVSIERSYTTGNLTSAGYNSAHMAGDNSAYIAGDGSIIESRAAIVDSYATGDYLNLNEGGHGSVSVNAIRTKGEIINCYVAGTRSASYGGSTHTLVSTEAFGWGLGDFALEPANLTNCYEYPKDSFGAAQLSPAFKDDTNGVNGDLPLLSWQPDEVAETEYVVTVSVTAADDPFNGAVIHVFTDAARTQELVSPDGVWHLRTGVYYYTVSAQGYATEQGSFRVRYSDLDVSLALRPKATVSFTLVPTDMSFVLTEFTSTTPLEPASASGATLVYELYAGKTYRFDVSAPGYNGMTREFAAKDGTSFDVALTPSSYGVGEGTYIWGSGNASKPSYVSGGGTYWLGEGATGTITLATDEPVTLVGTGALQSDAYSNVYIDCTREGTDLTVKDLSISNTIGATNMIAYQGQGNHLRFAGVSILDQNTGATGYAMVHVNSSTELEVGGVTADDTLYFYKREQGAGIGGNGGASGSEGQAPEYNGGITITGGRLFMKNSKQGALIGSGADASSTQFTPGPIVIKGGELNFIAISRGSALGGSAGSSGGATGADVTIEGGTINFNIDWSGAAIGGGGSESGNTSKGGVLHYLGGSIRTFIDYNATDSNGDGDTSDTLWPGVTSTGVSDVAITADKVDGEGDPVYLLPFDTSQLSGDAEYFAVSVDGNELYSGGLHRYAYVNEDLYKDLQVPVSFTMDNWVPLNDPHLYLYLTGDEHTLEVNGEEFAVSFDEASGAFDVTPLTDGPSVGAPGSGDLDGDGTATAAEALQVARAAIFGYGDWSAALVAAADIDGDSVVTASDAYRALRKAAGF